MLSCMVFICSLSLWPWKHFPDKATTIQYTMSKVGQRYIVYCCIVWKMLQWVLSFLARPVLLFLVSWYMAGLFHLQFMSQVPHFTKLKTMNYVVLQISIELCYVYIILSLVSRAHCILKRLQFNLSLGTKAILYMWWLWIHVELTNHIIYVVILA